MVPHNTLFTFKKVKLLIFFVLQEIKLGLDNIMFGKKKRSRMEGKNEGAKLGK